MKKIGIIMTVLSITIFLFSRTSFAGNWNGWIYQNPYPTKNTLLGVKFITPQKGWIVGEHGTILYTEDGGENWEAQESGTEDDLKSVAFVNEKVGWAVSNRGVIIHTEDGGKKWERQGNIKDHLHNVFFLNEKEGWVGGATGMFLHTINGGKTWNKHDISSDSDIASIFFRNSKIGWLLSERKIFKTTNGGISWRETAMLSTEGMAFDNYYVVNFLWLGDIFFVNNKVGWAVIGNDEIFYTSDGGEKWIRQYVDKKFDRNQEFYRLFFVNKKRGCAVGLNLVCTEDGGNNWNEIREVQPIPIWAIGEMAYGRRIGIVGMNFIAQKPGWIVGAHGWIMKTEDGGKNWMRRDRSFNYGYYFINNKTGWAVRWDDWQKKTKILRTDDGGEIWRVQKEFKEKAIDTVTYNGMHNGVFRSRKVEEKFDVETGVNSLFFINWDRGWVVGYQGHSRPGNSDKELNSFILHTYDGGKTWIIQYKIPGRASWFDSRMGALKDLFFVNHDVGWAVGTEGLILHTNDGGKNWIKQKSGTFLNLKQVQFIDNKTGWIIGDRIISEKPKDYPEDIHWMEAVILYTEDGGEHWFKQWSKRDIELRHVFFINKNIGWLTGKYVIFREFTTETSNLFFHTKNGGKTWVSDKGRKDKPYGFPFFIDEKRGWIEIGDRLLLITEDGGKTWKRLKSDLHKYPWRPFN